MVQVIPSSANAGCLSHIVIHIINLNLELSGKLSSPDKWCCKKPLQRSVQAQGKDLSGCGLIRLPKADTWIVVLLSAGRSLPTFSHTTLWTTHLMHMLISSLNNYPTN